MNELPKTQKTYVAFKNMLHNEFKITKEELKEQLNLAIKSKISEIVNKKLQELDLDDVIKKSFEKSIFTTLSNSSYNTDKSRFYETMGKEVAKLLIEDKYILKGK